MSDRRWVRWSLRGLALVGLAWACRESSTPATAPIVSMDLASPVVQVGKFILCTSTPPGTSGTFEVDVFLSYPITYLFGPSSEGDFVSSGQCRLVKTVDQAQNPTSISAYENIGLTGTTPGFNLVSVTIITDSGSVTLPGAGIPANPARCTVTLTTGCIMVFDNTPNGTVVLNVPLSLIDSGNLQAHYDQPHK